MGFCLLYMEPYDPKVSILLFQYHTCKRCRIFLKQNFALKLSLWGTALSALRMPTFHYVLPHGKLHYILPQESFILFHHIDSSIMFHHMESSIMFYHMESFKPGPRLFETACLQSGVSVPWAGKLHFVFD